MTPERWLELKSLFDRAVERQAAERPAFLAAVCAGDPELLAELESLLEADAGELVAHDGEERTERIGPYRVIREIGRGGMSRVYLAARADDQYQKRVAIKLIRQGMDSGDARRRFRRERQILAGLDHPAIARLYDGGTTDGLPYFVMEYIEGQPLDRYCDRHRLAVDERLGLFLDVCSAVGFAHQNLVVHRDLKPANILVTGDGQVKLLDFGIAKFLNPEIACRTFEPTAPGLQPLTPTYSSPEQVRGEPITTASDVYSLGVLLYGLLTGRPPYAFESGHAREIERVVCEVEPRRPSEVVGELGAHDLAECRGLSPASLRRRLTGDLDAIVAKSLEKEPRLRYPSVEQLAADLRRHLEHLPITASEAGIAGRALKLLRRQRLAAAVSTLVLAFGAAMTVQSVWLARALGRAEAERAQVEKISAFLVDLFAMTDPEAAEAAGSVRGVLDRGAEKIAAELDGEPRAQAGAMDAIGRAYRNLGLYDRAEPLLEDALEVRRSVLGEEHPDVATSLHRLGMLRHSQGDYRTAESLHRQGLALRRRLFGERHPLVAASLHDLAEALHTQGDYDAAEGLYRQALALRRELLGREHREVAESLSELAFLLQDRGDYGAAERLLEASLALHRRLFGEEHVRVATDLAYLAWTLQNKGEPERAEACYRQALTMRRKLLGEAHPAIAITLGSLGYLLYTERELAEAEALLRQARSVWERARDGDHPELGTVLNDLALVLAARGDPGAAVPLFRRALEICRRFLGEDHVSVATILGNLAAAVDQLGDEAAAEPLYREALRIKRVALPGEHPGVAYALRDLGQFLLDGGAAAAAEPFLREGVEILRRALGAGDWRIADAESRLGDCLTALGRYPEAEPLLRSGVAGLEGRGEEDPRRLAALERMVRLYDAWGRGDEAAAHRRRLAATAGLSTES